MKTKDKEIKDQMIALENIVRELQRRQQIALANRICLWVDKELEKINVENELA